MKKIMILLIRGYQIFVSPLFPKTCRFYPTCSTYFIQALEKYGFLKEVISVFEDYSNAILLIPGGMIL